MAPTTTLEKPLLLILRLSLLSLACLLAFAVRLFPVLRFGTLLLEFDPFFNHRSTRFLAQHGYKEFLNWFDHRSWHPLGRATGRTAYPGLMATAALLHRTAAALLPRAPSVHELCVLFPPLFAANTVVATYFLGKEVWDEAAGLVAAALMALCTGYTSRSVAGFFDTEAIGIFAMVLTFLCFARAVRTGSAAWACAAAAAYFYLLSGWGGYVYVINLVPLYVVVLLLMGRYSARLYVAYSCMYVLAVVLATQVRYVRYQHVQTAEHMAAMGVFFLLQVFFFLDWVKDLLKGDEKKFRIFLKITVATSLCVGSLALAAGRASGYITPWTGRLYSLLHPTHAKGRSPIIASITEHNSTTWAAFMRDFHVLLIFFPAGLYFCFARISDATVFLVLYGMTSLYFSGVMVRLILVATPAVCITSAIAISTTMKNLTSLLRENSKPGGKKRRLGVRPRENGKYSERSLGNNKAPTDEPSLPYQRPASMALLVGLLYLLSSYAGHSTWVTAEVYSAPSVAWTWTDGDGELHLLDDYREAYSWLRHNSPPDAKVLAWWDYGYQISDMANRTVIVDNNTWNSTHIAMVGRALASYEDEAYDILRSLDVDYVLVVFGGYLGYKSDDIDKFLWMVRIAQGVYPDIKENDYLRDGHYRLDSKAAPKMLNCLMYKLCYYRFGELLHKGTTGYDFARRIEIGNKDVELTHLEEAFTSANWVVRIYKVKPPSNRR